MSRGLSAAEISASTARNSISIPLVEILFASGPLRLALGGQSVNATMGLFTAANLLTMEPVDESADSTEGVRFALNGIDAAILARAAGEPYYRRRVNVYEQWLNASYQAVAAPRLEWCGVLTSLVIEEQGGKAAVSATAEHFDADLTQPRVSRYNNADQLRRHPGDTGFSDVEQMSEITLVWPSKEALQK